MAVVTPPSATPGSLQFLGVPAAGRGRRRRVSAADWRRRHQRRARLLLIVEKQPEGNTLQVTRDVEAALAALRRRSPASMDSTIFRPATFIEMSLRNLNRALLIGCVLVVVVLALFLWDWRTAVISLTAIPLSLLAAALVLSRPAARWTRW